MCVVVVAGLLAVGAGAIATAAAAAPSQFGSEGSGAGQFIEPLGVSVSEEAGDVYIADRNNNRVDEFDAEGKFILAWGWGVGDGATEALQTCTAECFQGLRGSGSGEFKANEGIAVDNSVSLSRGDVYVVDTANHRVQKFGPSGEFKLMFGREVNAGTKGNVCLEGEACKAGVVGAGSGEFTGPSGRSIAIDAAGTVYVGDQNRVEEFSQSGAFLGEVALPGVGAIENLAVDSAKDIYVKGSAATGVRKFDGTGTELPPALDEAGEGERQAIASGPGDDLFVNDFQAGSHHLLTYNSSGTQIASFDAGSFPEDGQRGIAYSAAAKALYVLNEASVRIVSPPPPGPFISPGSETASEIKPTSATLHATINPEGPGVAHYFFEYGTTATYGQSTAEEELTGGPFEDQPASAPITGLEQNTTYHFRVVAENAAKEVTNGPDQTFTTLPPVQIDSISVAEVDSTSARLEAELNPLGVASEYRFEYGTTSAYGEEVPIPDGSLGAGNSDVTVKNVIQELLPATTYHYRVTAHNELGTSRSPDRTFTTEGEASTLPDGRFWEQVSPQNKHGAPLEPLTEEGGIIQAAADGGGLAYVGLGPVNVNEDEPEGVRSPEDSQFLASRGASGWSTTDVTTQNEEITLIGVGHPSEYRFFSEGLQAGFVEPPSETPLSEDATERTPYRREADGKFVPLVTADNVLPGVKFGGFPGTEFRTATPDGSHAILVSQQLLTSGFEAGFEPAGNTNLYELTAGSLQLVSILPDGKPAAEEGLGAGLGHQGAFPLDVRGALSDDGNRVVFETGSEEHLYLRDVALQRTLQLDEVQPGAAGGPGRAVFQAASGDGKRVLFTDAARLTANASSAPGKPDLYMCEVGVDAESHLTCTLSDLSVDHNAGESANVQGEVSAIDAVGDHVYFAANGVLTSTPNANGEHAVPGVCNSEAGATCNLYGYDASTRQTNLVAVLSSNDDPDWAGATNLRALGNLTARSSPDGRYFAFMSQRSLTGYDNRDARSGAADEEVFLLDAPSGTLRCVSCDPTGARPEGVFDAFPAFPGLLVDHPRSWRSRWLAGSIPGWTLGPSLQTALYQSRYLSNAGRMFFNAADSLAPQDTNGVEDVYQYEPPGVGDCTISSKAYSPSAGGCVSLISSGSAKEESAFLDASESGDDAFFLTQAKLSETDLDNAFDVYDAHVCTASSPCQQPATPAPTCEGGSCQTQVSPPAEETPGSLTYSGPGNAMPSPAKPKPPTRAQLLAKALRSCKKKPQKKKRAACERQARKKYGSKAKKKVKKPRGRRATAKRGTR